MDNYGIYTPFADSLCLQTLAYRALGHQGMQDDGPFTIPESLLVCNQLEPVKREEAEEDTSDWPDDYKLDDPRRGQAKWLNR